MSGERSRGSSVPTSSATLGLIGLLILPTARSTTMLVTNGIHDWIPCGRDWQDEWVGFTMYSHWQFLSTLTSSHCHHYHYYYSDLHAHVTSLYITTVLLKGREESLPLIEKKQHRRKKLDWVLSQVMELLDLTWLEGWKVGISKIGILQTTLDDWF